MNILDFRKTAALLVLGLTMLTAGCSTAPIDGPPLAAPDEIVELTRAIQALGPNVDAEEAARAARIAFTYTHQLAQEYQITDRPLIHNAKVNAGLRPRGLCWHWAEDIQNRLNGENFETLVIHRGIANSEATFRIEHSTSIIAQAGDGMYDGIVLDPWRFGGVLFWGHTDEDPDYEWDPQADVLAKRRAEQLRETRLAFVQ